MFSFHEHEVVLPLVVLSELEAKRHDPELGGAARAALRSLESLRASGGDLKNGVVITPEGGTLRIEVNHADRSQLPDALRNDHSNDTRILTVAHALQIEGRTVRLISKDLPMRILASAVCGVPAEDYRADQVPDTGYTGIHDMATTKEALDALFRHKTVRGSLIDGASGEIGDLPAHSGLRLTANGSSGLARVLPYGEVGLVDQHMTAFGARPRSSEQQFALANLLDPDIGIVSLGGPGGTGKSLLCLAAGLEAVLERRTHERIIVFRPLYAVGGQELGYLPGAEAEKMNPWAAAVFDALHAFCDPVVVEEVVARNLIEVLPLTHIRGRTFTNSIIILDEAQNLERNVLLTALSRTGDNTRVFLSHDVAQRDNLHVGRHDGIVSVVERLKGEDLFAHTTLTKSERSPVAALVTRLLDNPDL